MQLEDSFDEYKMNTGVRVVQLVNSETPAAKAGIQINDVILSVDDQVVRDREDLTRRIASTTIGSEVVLKYCEAKGKWQFASSSGPVQCHK